MTYIPNLPSLLSTGNSNNTPLTNGATFTGTSELNRFQDVMINVHTDQSGILYAEFSTDNINWDTSLSFNYNTSRINPPHILVKGYRYFRVRFTNNSGSDQTEFRLSTVYGTFNKLTSPINGVIAENYDAIATRPTDFSHEVAIGKRQGVSIWNKWGYNDDIDIGGEEIIAPWGGSFVPRDTATTITIVSSSTDDITSTGSGIRAVVITGVDANRQQQIEVVQMNGTTPIVTTSTWKGINRVVPFLCGSTLVNQGTVTITATVGGEIMAQMPAGENATQQAIFHIQSNHTFVATSLHVNVLKLSGGGGSPEVTVRAYVYSPVANAIIQVMKIKLDVALSNTLDLIPLEPFPITESSVLFFTAETDKDNTSIDIRFSGKEQRNQ